MGDQENPQEWVNEGKADKKDKFYVCPSGEVDFQSNVEVLQSGDTLDKEDEVNQKKTESSRSAKTVVFEKAIPDGLPPGWTKVVKITRKGGKIRRDPYYTDPATGYIFRSMKDALRYIDTGDLGRLACKPKDKEETKVEVEEDDAITPAATKKQKLEDEEASSLSADVPGPKSRRKDELMQHSTFPGISSSDLTVAEGVNSPNVESNSSRSERIAVPDGLAFEGTSTVDNTVNESNGKGDSIKYGSLVSPAASDHQFSMSVLPMNNTKDQSNANIDSSSSEFCATPAAKVAPGEQPMDNVVGCDESKSHSLGRSKKKKDLSTPRRASKRLAGLQVDPSIELKTTIRTRRVDVVDPALEHEIAQTVAEDTASHQTDALQEAMDGSSGDEHHKIHVDKHSNGDIGGSNQLAEDGNREFAAAPPMAVQAGTEEHHVIVGTDNYIDKKLEASLDLPLGELWQDPCIAFAIQTLTGFSFDGIKVSQDELGFSATADSAAPEHPSEVADIISKNNNELAMASSTQSIPPADAWSDPCIEFAIKTLTDAIPLDYGLMIIQDLIPHQSTSSQSRNSGESCQTKFLCQPFGTSSGQPMFNQPGCVEPAMPLPGTTSLHYPSRASHQRSNDRSKKRIS